MNRPPPYFPQNTLNPPDEKRYKKFKMVIATILFFVVLGIIGAGIGIFYLIKWLVA